MVKYVRVMDKDVSNASGKKFKINEVNVAEHWDPSAKTIDTIKGINFSTEESIIRWIRRGDTLYEVELPPDAEVIKVPGTFTPDGIFRTNKIIVKNPIPLTEDVVMELYKKSNIPEKTYRDVLGILAVRNFHNVCMELIKDKVTKDNIEEFLNDYIKFENDIRDNNYGSYFKYKEILEEIKSPLDISVHITKEPYEKELTTDNIINLTGQSGSGKSTYAKERFNNSKFEIIDTDDIFNDNRYNKSIGLNKELGKYFRDKYKVLPNLSDDFDQIYEEIINYCKSIDKTIIIDCAQFHCIRDINKLKGKIIILRTDINTCYERTISRWINEHEDFKEEELNKYKEKKKAIYTWYKGTNEFIRKIDSLKDR